MKHSLKEKREFRKQFASNVREHLASNYSEQAERLFGISSDLHYQLDQNFQQYIVHKIGIANVKNNQLQENNLFKEIIGGRQRKINSRFHNDFHLGSYELKVLIYVVIYKIIVLF